MVFYNIFFWNNPNYISRNKNFVGLVFLIFMGVHFLYVGNYMDVNHEYIFSKHNVHESPFFYFEDALVSFTVVLLICIIFDAIILGVSRIFPGILTGPGEAEH